MVSSVPVAADGVTADSGSWDEIPNGKWDVVVVTKKGVFELSWPWLYRVSRS